MKARRLTSEPETIDFATTADAGPGSLEELRHRVEDDPVAPQLLEAPGSGVVGRREVDRFGLRGQASRLHPSSIA